MPQIPMRVYVTPKCYWCGLKTEMRLDMNPLFNWMNGMSIQEAFPDKTPAEREHIKTGIHPACWDKMFVSVEWYVDFIASEYGRLYGIPQDDLPTYDRLWLDNFTPNTKENAHQMAIDKDLLANREGDETALKRAREIAYEGPIVNDTDLTVDDRDYESAKQHLLAACMAISPNGKVQAGFASAFNAHVRDDNSPRETVLYLAGMLIDGVRHGNWPVSV